MTQIHDLAEGDIISRPGFYRCPLSVHHAQPCMTRERLAEIMDGDPIRPDDQISVTSGVLRTMELATPADVWAFSLLNPARYEKPDSPALRMGRAMAAYVEGGMDEVSEHFLILPEDKPRKPTPQQIEAYDQKRATEAQSKPLDGEIMPPEDTEPHPEDTDADGSTADQPEDGQGAAGEEQDGEPNIPSDGEPEPPAASDLKSMPEFGEGQEAAVTGFIDVDQCPYKDGIAEAKAWRLGFVDVVGREG